MKINGFTFVKNAIKYGYPVAESIKSVLPIVDEMIVCVGDSEDETNKLVESIGSEKIKIIHSVWDNSLREGGKVLAVETNKAMDATAHLGIKAACTVLSLSTLAMILTPGGIGSFPIFVANTLLFYHIANTNGAALGWLIWGVSTAIVIVAGLLSLVLLPYLNKKTDALHTGHTE